MLSWIKIYPEDDGPSKARQLLPDILEESGAGNDAAGAPCSLCRVWRLR